jgi:hypothetical protein
MPTDACRTAEILIAATPEDIPDYYHCWTWRGRQERDGNVVIMGKTSLLYMRMRLFSWPGAVRLELAGDPRCHCQFDEVAIIGMASSTGEPIKNPEMAFHWEFVAFLLAQLGIKHVAEINIERVENYEDNQR